jgi:hypothetical protein
LLKRESLKNNWKVALRMGELFSAWTFLEGGLNLKSLWRSYLTNIRGPISYRIFFMAY